MGGVKLPEVMAAVHRLKREQRGFDTSDALSCWFHPSGPDELTAAQAARMAFVIISDVAAFAAAQLAVGEAEAQDASDVQGLTRAADEIGAASGLLRDALARLAEEVGRLD